MLGEYTTAAVSKMVSIAVASPLRIRANLLVVGSVEVDDQTTVNKQEGGKSNLG